MTHTVLASDYKDRHDRMVDYCTDLQRIVEDLCAGRDIREPFTSARHHYHLAVHRSTELAAALEATASPVTDAMVEAAYEKVRKMPASVDTAVGDLDTIVRAALSASPPSSAVVTDAVAAALREATELLKELDLGRSIHNDRRPDQKIDGPLWAQIGRVVGTAQAALSAALPLTAPPARGSLDPLALEALKNNQRQLDMDGVEVGVSRQALDELISAYEAAPPARGQVEVKALRNDWHGVFLDGRNEHGSHVLMLPQRSIELEQDEAGNFLKVDAEAILSDAESQGFKIGQAVVALFNACWDEGFFSHYEFAGISPELTALLYGTPDEQFADSERRILSALTSPAEPALATGGEG